jgi:hypothetical protein
MSIKQCHKPAMTGNGKHTTNQKMVMTGGWFIILPTLHHETTTFGDGLNHIHSWKVIGMVCGIGFAKR